MELCGSWEQIAATIAAFLGGGGLVAIARIVADYLKDCGKRQGDRDAATDHIIESLLADYKAELHALQARLDASHEDHQDCQRQNAELREKIGALAEKVARNDEEIKQLKLFSCSVAGCQLRKEIELRQNQG